ncbi:circadian clock-controlled protein daywake-like [Malaya genurostris]|uniref:circadian clock-controlled protein daywake-like n=1 Tax=Malaya genurostris TaxID=325434 RepID=UPI0026F3CB54|nr:circadian clock-controlled protein daywake-like [Malaya genurostris]
MTRLIFAGLLLLVLNLGFSYAYLEPVLSVCKAKDPNLDKCIVEIIERIRPSIASGNYGSEIQHPRIESMILEQIRIERGPSFSANFSDLMINGSSKFIIKKLKTDLSQKQINVSVILPVLDVLGKYALNMNILVLRIIGKGDINVQLNDTKAILRLQYFTEQVDGKDLVRFRPIDLKLKFDKASFYLQNLFNGDPMLEKVGNDAINENPHVLLDEVKSSFEEGLSEKFTGIANSLVKDSELKEIFPE